MNASLRRLLLIATFAFTARCAADPAQSQWVHPGADGKLVYKTTPAGDRIMDFSFAGYMGGGVALPEVPARVTLDPPHGEDDSSAIQAAIDNVSAMPIENGFRGAVVLGSGTFTCARTITISASGVVLRGSGSGAGGTTILLGGRPHLGMAIRSSGGRGRDGSDESQTDPQAAQTLIADSYVPSGASSFSVADVSGFAAGDTININHPVTPAWIKFMQMDDMTRNGRSQTWIRAGSTVVTERRIASISGNRLTVDVPLSDSFDSKYLNPPGTLVVKIAPPGRITQSAIEHLHIQCPPQEISHTQPHFQAFRINGQDCWGRDVAIDETMNSVAVGGRRITLQQVSVNRKARHQGASKPAEFAPNGEQVLLDRCSVSADNVWFVATGAGHAGPIVVLNCTFLGNGRAESHQRWSTGLLYDNVRSPDGGIELRNRGSMGSGHGWSLGWGVVWNCDAKDFLVQNPPGAANWLIGSKGARSQSPRPFGSGPPLPEGIVDSHGAAVAPQSLYLAQLAERLGPAALKNIGYPADGKISPSDVRAQPRPDEHVEADQALGKDLALNRPVTTSSVRNDDRKFAGWNALDGDDKTCWATGDGVTTGWLELDTEGAVEINTVELGEASGLSQRVHEYKVEGQVDSDWKVLAQGTTIGERKIDHFPKVTVWKVRLTIVRSSDYPAIGKLGLYLKDPKGGS